MLPVVGRFAPSPTGALHLGSLVAATASYLNAKQQQGKWLVRIDDIDLPRVVVGSDAHIFKTLEDFGFEWDQLIYQSQRLDHYQQALSQLQQNNMLYACHCTRKQLKERTPNFPLYDRYCRNLSLTDEKNGALRFKSPLVSETAAIFTWQDLIQGEQQTRWQIDMDDFVVKRSDGLFAYHLACALDDVEFGITEVIRGKDLLASTAPQQLIQHLLGRQSPLYGHHPLIVDQYSGIKLSKASKAPALDTAHASAQLVQVLSFLGQTPPAELAHEPIKVIWQWAISNWQLNRIMMHGTSLAHQPPIFSCLSE